MPSLASLKVSLGLSTRGFTSGAARARTSLGSIKEKVEDLNDTGLGGLQSSLLGSTLTARAMNTALAATIASLPALTAGAVAASGAVGGLAAAAGAAGAGVAAFAVSAVGNIEKVTEAMEEGQAAVAQLNPAQQALAETIRQAKSAYEGFLAATAQPVSSALSDWLGVVRPALNIVTPITNEAADAIGRLGQRAQQALASPFWQQFGNLIESNTAPAITKLGTIAENVLTAIAGAVRAFMPLGQDILSWLAQASGEWASWGKTLGQNQQFQRFIRFVRENGPVLLDTLIAVAGAVMTLLQAITPLGPPMLVVIQHVAEFINQNPLLVKGILGVVAAVKAWRIAQTALNWAMRANPIGIVITLLGLLVLGLVKAWQNSETFRNIVTGAWNGITTAARATWNFLKTVFSWLGSRIMDVYRWFADLPDKIDNALSGLGDMLRAAGSNAIQALINGMLSMLGPVGSAASSVASTIGSYLPFSPAETGPLSGRGDPTRSGQSIADMLSSGMLGNLPAVQEASGRLADAANMPDGVGAPDTPGVPRVPGVGRAGRGGGEPVPVRLELAGPEEMKRLISKIVRTDGRGDVQVAFGNG